MTDYERPDPDTLLRHVKTEESKQQQGKLKIFLGYAAGVGKTFAMLEAARQKQSEGNQVLVGYIETHNRTETESLLDELSVLPRRQISYKGVLLEEMDIDGILEASPQIVLVDELAHTNAPTSRHTKRYQDVEELLKAGIDVYTTLNIQHMESLNDVVAQITEVIVRETVPDRILARADQLLLVDLPPEELIQRLQEGKVYVPEYAKQAVSQFFRLGNLTALREIMLRRAARRVDEQMNAYMQTRSIQGPWAATERLMVCVSPSPLSQKLIRTACRLADELDAEWLAMYVDTPQASSQDDSTRKQLADNLQLAEQLGASVLNLPGDNAAETITHYAQTHNVTKIIIGKPLQPHWQEVLRGSVVDQLIRKSGEIDVYVISSQNTRHSSHTFRWLQSLQHRKQWVAAIVLVGMISLFGMLIYPITSPTNLVMFYLLGIVIAAIRYGRGAAMLTVVFSVIAFNVGFVPPRFTFQVSEPQYLLTFAILGGVGIVIADLAARVREHARSAQQRELYTSALYSLSRDLSATVELTEILHVTLRHITQTFRCKAALFIQRDGKLTQTPILATPNFEMKPNEIDVIRWVFEHGESAGMGTSTLPSVSARFLPLKTAQHTVGVLGIQLYGSADFTSEKVYLMEAFASHAALGIDAVYLSEEAQQAQLLKETERLQTALLNSISHDLRTPLVSITGALSSLTDQADYLDDSSRRELIQGAREEADRLNRLVGSLLEMTRLEAGVMKLNQTPSDLSEIIGVSISQLHLQHRDLQIDVPADLPMVNVDFVLVVQVISNLLENAYKYSSNNTPIHITAQPNGMVTVSITDHGIGIKQDELARIFEKFYRSEDTQGTGGSGLGLSICKGVIEAHGGNIWVKSKHRQGSTFSFTLPIVP